MSIETRVLEDVCGWNLSNYNLVHVLLNTFDWNTSIRSILIVQAISNASAVFVKRIKCNSIFQTPNSWPAITFFCMVFYPVFVANNKQFVWVFASDIARELFCFVLFTRKNGKKWKFNQKETHHYGEEFIKKKLKKALNNWSKYMVWGHIIFRYAYKIVLKTKKIRQTVIRIENISKTWNITFSV